MRLTLESVSTLSKVDCPPLRSAEVLNRMKKIKKEISLSCLFELGRWSFLPFRLGLKHCSLWVLSLPDFRLEFTPSALLILRPSNLDWNYTLALLGLQLAS